MANTRQSAKRARQNDKRRTQNTLARAGTRSALRVAAQAILAKDLPKAKEAYLKAVKTLSKAASNGALPKQRAARKISRLTLLAKKTLPELIASK